MNSPGGAGDAGSVTASSPEVGTEDTPGVEHFRRVLSWSGPSGWRCSRPRLVPRGTVAPAMSDAGFSLVELMVALLVMGILLAVAVPTFLGTTGAADDRSAQSNLGTALIDAKAQYQSAGQTFDVNGASNARQLAPVLNASQLQLTFKAGDLGPTTNQGSSGSASDVSVSVSTDGVGVVLAAFSVPGNCFYLVDNTGTLSPSAAASRPYVGAAPVTTTTRVVSGTLGLPTARGASYVTVSGDPDKGDCNAFSPMATGAGISARYQRAGFPPSTGA
jgi:type IV pilus assembly protein PilA